MSKEVNFFGKVIENPSRPFVAVVGGSKVSGKLQALTSLIQKVDKVIDQEQANIIYIKVMRFLKDDGVLVVKHQMGIEEDVVVDGYSKELESNYFSEYRWIKKERELLRGVGFGDIETIDIYPPEYNRWDNTHFYALVCKK